MAELFITLIYLAENMLVQFLLLVGFILTGPMWDLYRNDRQILQGMLSKVK